MRSESDPLQLFAGIKLTNGPGGDFLCLTPYVKAILHMATDIFSN